jgi:hypothetical protein
VALALRPDASPGPATSPPAVRPQWRPAAVDVTVAPPVIVRLEAQVSSAPEVATPAIEDPLSRRVEKLVAELDHGTHRIDGSDLDLVITGIAHNDVTRQHGADLVFDL